MAVGDRIYTRERGGEARYYADFRDYADVGGGQEALKPEGSTTATTDEELAEILAADRLKELAQLRQNKAVTGIREPRYLEEFAAFHLKQKAKAGQSPKYLASVEKHFERAVALFGANRELSTIRPSDVREWIELLKDTSNGRGGTLSDKTVRDHLNSLSNLYKRARSEEAVPSGYSPVRDTMDKPTAEPSDPNWLEVHEAALLLEAARLYEPDRDAHATPFIYEFVATYLLTGARRSEVLGLEVEDVSFDRRTIRIRPNEHRGLKSDNANRTVPLWPQLREILQPYIFNPKGPKSGLLFPSPRRKGKKLDNCRKQLDAVGKTAGFEEGMIRTKIFRHTYTAARLQTLDHGAPVAKYTVQKELGHGSSALVDRIYGHLGQIRHRAEAVEYRVENHEKEIGDAVRELQNRADFVTTSVTTAENAPERAK